MLQHNRVRASQNRVSVSDYRKRQQPGHLAAPDKNFKVNWNRISFLHLSMSTQLYVYIYIILLYLYVYYI